MSFFTKKNVPTLSDVIFTDGHVLSFCLAGDTLKLLFLDYAESELEIIFYTVTQFEGTDAMFFVIASYILIDEQQKLLKLFDDENKCVFLIKFSDAEVSFVKENNNL